MNALLAKVADITGVSVHWLRSGDPAEAPPWADRKQVALDAVRALPDRDRAWMLREIDKVFAADDVEHAPAQATAELAQLRSDRELAATGIQTLHRQVVEQLAAVERLAKELGVTLGADEAKPRGRQRPTFPMPERSRV
jgi:predicted secreted protein